MTRTTGPSSPAPSPGGEETPDTLTHETITRLLLDWSGGDPEALQAVVPLVLEDLRSLARQVASDRPAATLQPTALVNELYLRLRKRRTVTWTSRAQFFGFAAQAMRRILIDAARGRRRQKRGGGAGAVDLDELTSSLGLPAPDPVDLLALDSALERLEALDPRQVRVVELRFFAGLPMGQVAEALGISRATANRDWSTARAWLFRELSSRPPTPTPGSTPA